MNQFCELLRVVPPSADRIASGSALSYSASPSYQNVQSSRKCWMRSIAIIRRAGWKIAAFLLGLIVVALVVRQSKEQEPIDVWVTSPQFRDITASLNTNGKVMLLTDFQARSAFAGMVEKIYVHVGQKVHPGQMLIKMKDPFAASRFASANAALQGARLSDQNVLKGGSQEERINLKGDLVHAQTVQKEAIDRLALLRRLEQKNAVSAGEVAEGEQRLKDANATLQTLSERSTKRFSQEDVTSSAARVADARASFDSAKVVVANANITSSIEGTVYSIPASTYDFVPMGADLLRVADLRDVQIRAYFDEPEIGALAVDQAVEVTWDAKPNQSWHGRVKQAPLTVMPLGTRTVGECIITVDNPNGDLLPNTDVKVTVTVKQQSHVLTVPREALQTDGTTRFVYRVIDGKLHKTKVSVGIVNLAAAQIIEGLSPTDVIAVSATNYQSLVDGLKVKPVQHAF
jgi:HlyD family secretion protein